MPEIKSQHFWVDGETHMFENVMKDLDINRFFYAHKYHDAFFNIIVGRSCRMYVMGALYVNQNMYECM